MSNALNPELMTPAERIAEIARILALGLAFSPQSPVL